MDIAKLLVILATGMAGMVMISDVPIWLFPSVLFILMYPISYLMNRRRPIYLVDFAVARPPWELRMPAANLLETMDHMLTKLDPKLTLFCENVMSKSCMGENTCLPETSHYLPPRPSKEAALEEFRQVIFTPIDDVFASTGISPEEIDVVVVNCSGFGPTPSLTAFIVNHYKMRDDVKCFNLSGMGCSAEMVSLDIARSVLQSRPDTTALFASTEIMTPYGYYGTSREMQVTNCIFRMGGAAIILSNKSKHRAQSKYQLLHLIRTHTGYEESSYQCVHQKEDPDGMSGFALARSLPITAGEALRINVTTLAPLVLPATERLRLAPNYVPRRFWEKGAKPYVPNFRLAFNHFCIHAGGPAVIESVQKNLRLSSEDAEASWMTLYRFGNTSSSSPWYSMAYAEAKRKVKKGDKVWQIALGSGFKCSTASWKSLRTVQPTLGNAWLDCIDDFPVEVSRQQNLHGDRKE